MAALLPGAGDLDRYWHNLRDGVDAVGDVPDGRWDAAYYRPGAHTGPAAPDEVYCRRGGFVDGLARIDPTRFGIMPNTVAGTEPDQLIALDVAAAAIADAGGPDRLPDRARVGVVLGRGGYLTPGLVRLDQRVRTAHQLVRTLGELLPDLPDTQLDRVREAFTARLGPDRPESAIGLVPSLAASRVANRLDLGGPAYTVDAACASSLVAVDQAIGELASGRCDVMLAGGVHHCHDITLWSVFSQLRALSPSQRSRPFHRDADGILIGEGTGVVVLKRLADAERDGDRIYAVVRGTGVASDGRAAGPATPDPGGQARAVRAAWRAAGLDPAQPGSIGLLEAHGTATPAGDTAELATLADVFGAGTGEPDAVIGSVKSMIGHAMPAAGVAGLIKAALALHHATLLPTLHCDDPHPALAATRFRPLATARPWETTGARLVRRAAVNAFGFGGINAHVVLEEAPDRAAESRSGKGRAPAVVEVAEPERVLLLAADGPEGLARLLDTDDAGVLAAGLDPDRAAREAGPVRLGVVDPTGRRLALARRAVARGEGWHGRDDVWFRPRPLLGPGHGGLVFVFPGLEADFAPRVEDVAAHFGLAATSARDGRAARVGDVGRHGFEVVAVGRLLDRALRRMGVVPDAVAGHSVGEWTAMTVAGMYSGDEVDAFMAGFDPDSVSLPGLAFGAVGASAERVVATLDEDGWAAAGVVLSHDNAPGQSMVCGPQAAVEEFVRDFRARGVLSQVLPFRSGFHTPMLAPCLGPIEEAARRLRLRPPAVPVWSGTTAAPFPADEPAVRELFVRHLLEPVRFRQLVEALYAAGHRAFVQCGPGRLGGLIGDTLRGRDHLVVPANSPHRDGLAQLRRVAAALWSAGADPVPRLDADRPADTPATTAPATAAAPAPAPAPAPRGRPMRLDLDAALVSLDDRVAAGLRAGLRPADAGLPPVARTRPLTAWEDLAVRHPVAAELSALMRDTADTATALLAARARRTPLDGAVTPAAAPTRTPTAPAARAQAQVHTPAPTPAPAATPGAPPAAPWQKVVRVAPDSMPYLLDHCFFPQRPGWPDVADRWPVVPATTIVEHLMDAAAEAAPGLLPVAVHGARFEEWLTATPAVDVTVTAVPRGPDRLAVSFGPRARAVVELAAALPAERPERLPVDPESERVPEHTAAQLYAERWMFHGPRFQGMTELTAIGNRHVRGVLTTPPAPGALLDNAGQLLGYWIMATRTERTVVFPVRIGELRFHGRRPAPGTEVECVIRVTSLTDTVLEADIQLSVAGEVWADIRGWQDRRFDNDPTTRPVERFPERHTLSKARPGGWALLFERWPDLASRELIMRNSLGGEERAEYAALPPRGRRQWLLGRIAVKDAVRQWLWDQGDGPVFPAEIRVRNDASGRPFVVGLHGRELPPLDVSLAHRAEAGAAIVRPRADRPGADPTTAAAATGPGAGSGLGPGTGPAIGPGIDLEEVVPRTPQTVAAALGPDELRLLRALSKEGGGTEALWFTRFWAAKEAVAKAEGTGFGGRPRDFAVAGATGDGTLLTVSGRRAAAYTVHTERVANPPLLPARDYVVAWTEGHPHEEDSHR
ncbi:type I polyketide synthase [Streptomyces mangrovisoli]|uniref:Beta-ketoacyl synthase n=1 Tax=Streptomyces mangrovisoli TaxID=1428628 RepID=A0A1J4NQB8_9ACTN|nr:beta-ketoacyl synthase [Streptomyces mangrovisoli]